MSIRADLQRRSAHIHWPEGIVPEEARGHDLWNISLKFLCEGTQS
jgi:hypothetical protein